MKLLHSLDVAVYEFCIGVIKVEPVAQHEFIKVTDELQESAIVNALSAQEDINVFYFFA